MIDILKDHGMEAPARSEEEARRDLGLSVELLSEAFKGKSVGIEFRAGGDEARGGAVVFLFDEIGHLAQVRRESYDAKGFLAVGVVSGSPTLGPVTENFFGEDALCRNGMHQIEILQSEREGRPCQVMNIKVRDGCRHDIAMFVRHGMMEQGD